eukprot:1254141-Amphidinium_carterae.1
MMLGVIVVFVTVGGGVGRCACLSTSIALVAGHSVKFEEGTQCSLQLARVGTGAWYPALSSDAHQRLTTAVLQRRRQPPFGALCKLVQRPPYGQNRRCTLRLTIMALPLQHKTLKTEVKFEQLS